MFPEVYLRKMNEYIDFTGDMVIPRSLGGSDRKIRVLQMVNIIC